MIVAPCNSLNAETEEWLRMWASDSKDLDPSPASCSVVVEIKRDHSRRSLSPGLMNIIGSHSIIAIVK